MLLIVLEANARENLIEHLLGSVADHVVRSAKVPVLVIPYGVE